MIDGTVIIGTAPSLQNSNMGEYIDSFKYVIRFPFKGDWQIPEHYGIRTSYFCSTHYRVLARNQLNPWLPDCGYFIWNKYNKDIGSELRFLIRTFGGEDVTGLINEWQAKLPEPESRGLSHCFSTGTGGICIAAAKLQRPIVVLGCDYIKNGGGPVEEYVGTWFWEGGKKPTDGGYRRHHPFKAERELIDVMAKEYNVSIEFK